MQSKLPSSIILVISASLAVLGIIPVYHQASAKECNDSSCSDDKQDSKLNNDDSNNEHSSNSDDGSSNSVQKDNTPFVLSTPVPFP